MTAHTAAFAETIGITDSLDYEMAPVPRLVYQVTKPNQVSDPSYSPDGTQIVFVELIGSTYSIVTLLNGATVIHSVLLSGTLSYADPTFSPDGFYILFAEQVSAVSGPHPYGVWRVKYMNVDGTGMATLIDDGNANMHPFWVTSNQVAFQSWQYGATPSSAFEISLIDAAGQNRMNIGTGEYPRTVPI